MIMKDKKIVLILGISAAVLLLVAGFLLWSSKKMKEVEEESTTGLPASVEKYYQESTPAPGSVSQLETTSDLDRLSKEVDGATVDIDSGLKQLDSDFSNF